MDKMEKGKELFEKHDVSMSYNFRMDYGIGHVVFFPNWKEIEDERRENQKDLQTGKFIDDEILNKHRSQMFNHIREIVNKTNLEKELHENGLFFGIHITISGTPSIPLPLSQSNSDYDEYVELK